jgi:hypothetical protein
MRACPIASSAAVPTRTPIRRTRSPCCARAASGHAAAAPPSSVMNSRRFTVRSLPCFRPKDSTARYGRRLLLCGISIWLMSARKFSLDIISAKVQIDSNRTSRNAFEFPILTLIGTPLSVPRGSSRLRPGERPLRGRIPWAMRTNIARWLCSTIARYFDSCLPAPAPSARVSVPHYPRARGVLFQPRQGGLAADRFPRRDRGASRERREISR